MEKQKTAVQWFQEQIIKIVNGTCELSEIEIFNQAKQMEKEQIIEAFEDGFVERQFSIESNAKHYYESKYGKDENKAENNS